MTRPTWPLPPTREALREWRLDRIVRELPEALAVLRREGLDPRQHGADPLARAAGARVTEVLEVLAATLAWRELANDGGASAR